MSDRWQPHPGPMGPNRRRFLQALGAAGAAAAAAPFLGCSSRSGGEASPLPAPTPGSPGPADTLTGRRMAGAVDDRILVVVDLQGGNDGLSTLTPLDDPTYRAARPSLAGDPDELLALDDAVGLHPALTRLHRRGITTVEGVGPIDGDLSHFSMAERWQRGDAAGTGGLHTGFLGRLADAVDAGSPLTGLSLSGPSPHLLTAAAATMALDGADALWFLEPQGWYETEAYQRGLAALADPGSGDQPGPDPLGVARSSYRDLLRLGSELAARSDEAGEADWSDPMLADGGWLGQQLYLAADLVTADVGVRIVYAADGDYDTHQDHGWRQLDNLTRLDAAVDGFLERAERLGFADRVLVATVSEFGRRVEENDGGLDHGSASTMLVAGPVRARRAGDRPGLDDLDDDGNLRVTVGFDRYLAALAEDWMGVEAASVLPGGPTPIEMI